MLWPRACSENFHKTNEYSNCSNEKFEHSVDHLSGRHRTDGSSLEKITVSRDTLTFILQRLGFLAEFQKSIVNPSHQIQFLETETDSLSKIVSLSLQKKKEIILLYQGLLNQ